MACLLQHTSWWSSSTLPFLVGVQRFLAIWRRIGQSWIALLDRANRSFFSGVLGHDGYGQILSLLHISISSVYQRVSFPNREPYGPRFLLAITSSPKHFYCLYTAGLLYSALRSGYGWPSEFSRQWAVPCVLLPSDGIHYTSLPEEKTSCVDEMPKNLGISIPSHCI